MKPVRFEQSEGGKLTGCIYLLGFPRQGCIYIGSTKRGGSRLREHGMWLKGKRHPNHALQEVYNECEGEWVRHVLLNVYGATNPELRQFEWGISIHLTSHYTILNEDTTQNIRFHLEYDIMKQVIDLVDSLMGVSYGVD